jgi:hypothetical protein
MAIYKQHRGTDIGTSSGVHMHVSPQALGGVGFNRKDYADALQFAQDQIDNYDECVTEEFSKGYRAALEVLLGTKVLEEYL